MQQELVLVVDFGGQYSQLIARRVRELGVYSEMIPFDTPLEEIRERAPRGLIFSGGPASIYLPGAPVCDPGVFELGLPLLGICYGMQLMAAQLGGKVEPAGIREYGKTALAVSDGADLLFAGLESQQQVWMSHGDSITRVPPGFHVTASTADCPIAAMAAPDKRFYGVQFHPEVRHTPNGNAMLRNFLYRVCGCQGTWRLADFVEETVREIRERVGDRHVICALSGGVDSSVAAVLVNRAVGDRLTCVFVDTGLLRKGEAEQVVRVFRDERKMNLVFVYARQRFLERLAGVTDPERKRIIIGHEFIRVFEEEAARIGRVDFLVQGTLYPDVVESGTRTSATIKTHHNVG
ncbi:MAG: glutamine-hydrolyzing GMP synthase, partial [Syntrophomonadaceae bacterium]|nr:glutamine-hydrolyzing GMP synthase [Syntrophomonadaceae bacterium]